MLSPHDEKGSRSSGWLGEFSKSTDLNDGITSSSNSPTDLPDSPGYDSYGFARAPSDFDPEEAKLKFSQRYGQGQGHLDVPEAFESVEDEIHKALTELEKVDGPLTEQDKSRIAAKLRSLREGAWLEGLKYQLVGKDVVPIEAFNRLVAEHEGTIAMVAAAGAKTERQMAEEYAELCLRNGVEDGELERLQKAANNFQQDKTHLELDNHILQEEKDDLQCRLHVCQERNKSLRDELRQLESSKSQVDETALKECQNALACHKLQLESAKRDLGTARETASRHYNDVQSLRQQKEDANRREQQCKDEIRNLRQDNKELGDTLGIQGDLISELQKRSTKIEAELAGSNARIQFIQQNNKDQVATMKEKASYLEGAREREQAKAREDQKLIETLKAELEKARQVQPPRQDESGSIKELQARCAELREARDSYREKWARGVVAGNASLTEFWQAVENTGGEIKQLYQGIERLTRLLGIADGVTDTPQVLDKIIRQVSTSVDDAKNSPQLTIWNLRVSNMTAQLQIEALQRQLENAQLPKNEDEIKAQLRIVDEKEVERRVSVRTRSYRNHRAMLLTHIFDAQFEFLALAERSDNRDAIEALVDRFLQPTSLPTIQLAQGSRGGEVIEPQNKGLDVPRFYLI